MRVRSAPLCMGHRCLRAVEIASARPQLRRLGWAEAPTAQEGLPGCLDWPLACPDGAPTFPRRPVPV